MVFGSLRSNFLKKLDIITVLFSKKIRHFRLNSVISVKLSYFWGFRFNLSVIFFFFNFVENRKPNRTKNQIIFQDPTELKTETEPKTENFGSVWFRLEKNRKGR